MTADIERCDFCGAALLAEHDHLLDVHNRNVLCACNECMFGVPTRQGLKPIAPRRYVLLDSFVMPDELWEQFQIPVGLAFFYWSSVENRVKAFYPSPMGATEVLLPLTEAWLQLQSLNASLNQLRTDIDALLVNRMRGMTPLHMLVPIDECYRLVGIMRRTWRGLAGGREAEVAILRYFEDLRGRATGAAEQEFVAVADADEIAEGGMKAVRLGEHSVLLARLGGTYYAIANTCSHAGGPLAEGTLHGKTVTCPWHLSQFDVTNGQVVAPPASRPQPVYRVRVEASRILIKRIPEMGP